MRWKKWTSSKVGLLILFSAWVSLSWPYPPQTCHFIIINIIFHRRGADTQLWYRFSAFSCHQWGTRWVFIYIYNVIQRDMVALVTFLCPDLTPAYSLNGDSSFLFIVLFIINANGVAYVKKLPSSTDFAYSDASFIVTTIFKALINRFYFHVRPSFERSA